MGKPKKQFLLNRRNKIERNKRRRKYKRYSPYYSKKTNTRKLRMNNSQKTFSEANFYKKSITSNKKIVIDIPKIFCIIENPNNSLETVKKINFAFEKTNATEIIFNYSKCEKLGLDASVLTDLVVLNGLKFRKYVGVNARLSGDYPITHQAIEVFLNSGLVKHLNLNKKEDPRVVRLEPFEEVKKETNLFTNKTIKYYDRCLRRYGYCLNDDGHKYFVDLVGEIIGNADEHSGDNGDWYVSGHFSHVSDTEYGKGSLVFISIGNTIYENLKNNVKSEEVKNKLIKHSKHHKSFFDITWNEEASWTVFGLQYKISSEKDINNPDRGTGTIKFIDSFDKLGKNINDDKPQMSIMSGKTHIFFDGTYTLKSKRNSKDTKVIAFNDSNDLLKKPDENAVKLIQNGFPGVIISVEFYVDGRYLKKMKEGDLNEQKN